MKIKGNMRRILVVTLSLLYIASASPLTFAAIKLDHGHAHSVKLSFDDGHVDLIYGHEEHSSEEHNSEPPYDSDHKVHIQEEQSNFSSSQIYSAPELAYVSDALSQLVLTSISDVEGLAQSQEPLTTSDPGWVKLRTVMLI